jgi:hypothetical protein
LCFTPTYNTVGGSGLDFELSVTDGEVLAEKVLTGLANIIESNCSLDRVSYEPVETK